MRAASSSGRVLPIAMRTSSFSSRGHSSVQPLIRSTLDGGGRSGYSTADAADLAVALAGVRVADEERARPAERTGQVGDAARPHVGQVHVAAVVVGRQRVDRVDLGRAAQRADVRLVGQRDPLAPVHPLARRASILRDDLRQRRIERRRVVGAASARRTRGSCSRCTRGLGPRGGHRFDVDGKGVAFLGALDHDRPILRVERRASGASRLGRVRAAVLIAPSNASRVSTTTRSPGLMRRTGGWSKGPSVYVKRSPVRLRLGRATWVFTAAARPTPRVCDDASRRSSSWCSPLGERGQPPVAAIADATRRPGRRQT